MWIVSNIKDERLLTMEELLTLDSESDSVEFYAIVAFRQDNEYKLQRFVSIPISKLAHQQY